MNKPVKKRIILLLAGSVFFCLVIMQIFVSVDGKKNSTLKSYLPKQSKPNIDLDSELKKIEILFKMGFENADIYYNRGWIYAEKGQYDLAKKNYTEALKLDKNHADAYLNRGLIFFIEKKYQEAISDFTEAIKSDPKMTAAYGSRGNAYLNTGKAEMALDDYTKAITIDGKDPDLYYNRAFILRALGRFKDADIDMKKAEELGIQPDSLSK